MIWQGAVKGRNDPPSVAGSDAGAAQPVLSANLAAIPANATAPGSRIQPRVSRRIAVLIGLIGVLVAGVVLITLGMQPTAPGSAPAPVAKGVLQAGQPAPAVAQPASAAADATNRSRSRPVHGLEDGQLPAGSPAPADGRPAPPVRPAAILPAAVLPPVYRQWITLRAEGFQIRYGARTWTVPGTVFTGGLHADSSSVGSAGEIQFDSMALAQAIAQIADAVDVPAQDARYRLVGGQAQIVARAQAGQQVDQTASLVAVRSALAARRGAAALVVVPRPPAVGDDLAGPVNVPDRLASAATSYKGSSRERAHNVEFGASLVDGALVAPGQEFDLNATLGPLTLDAGFQMGFAIEVDGDGVTTVPAEAGGICQVATTLFQSVFWAGLPITERHHHSYWINSYGVAPSGLQGLDATIAPPDANFRWVNSTGHWILVRAHAGQGTVRFELWGTDPHWQVRVNGPAITRVVPTSYAPIYEKNAAIPRGTTRLVEHAQPGFTADIRRRVYNSAGTLLDDWHAQGTYLPAHNRYLVGR